MSEATPYYFLAGPQLARIESSAQAAIVELHARWEKQPVAVVVTAQAFTDGEAFAREIARHIIGKGERFIAVLGSDKTWQRCAEQWLGCDVEKSTAFIKTLEQRYCRELFSALSGLPTTPEIDDLAHWPALRKKLNTPGIGAVILEINIGNASYKLLTTAALWSFLAEPAVGKSQVKLAQVASALGQCKTVFEARLPAVEMPLVDIAGLQAGDFLDLRLDLSGRVELGGKQTALMLSAVLGRHVDNKAAQICDK